tara:strand:- start:20344 stop:21417 length:1074 start_codon:yes stop_codon:yes gene_type:complete
MASPASTTDLLIELTQKLSTRVSLEFDEASKAAGALASSEPPVETKESFLRELARKGESPEEVFAFAQEFRKRAIDPKLEEISPRAIDIVGTGGDKSGTFNFSTATALLLAAMGVPVMKHGNRSITSKSGSADLIASLGVSMEGDHDYLRSSLEEFNFCFFFAPAFHPSFKEIMPVRKRLAETGTRTIFNLLGPLINPGKPANQLMGVFHESWLPPIAGALDSLGLESALVVHCKISETQGVDELTVSGANFLEGAGRLKGQTFPSAPSEYGLTAAPLVDIQGGDAAQNSAILRKIADTTQTGPIVDTLLFNAGAALFTCGRAESIPHGIETSRSALQSGILTKWMDRFEDFNRKQS